MVNYCEALGELIEVYYKLYRYEGTPKYDELTELIIEAFTFNVDYGRLVNYMFDNAIPLTPQNIVKLLKSKNAPKANIRNDKDLYRVMCANIFMFLNGLLGISRLKDKDRKKYMSILSALLSVDTNWNAVWTLFFSRGNYNLKALTQILLEVFFEEFDVPIRELLRKIKIKKLSKDNYTIVLKVSKDYVKVVDAKKHSVIKKRLGNIQIEL